MSDNAVLQQTLALGRLASRLGVAKPGPRRALIAAEASGYASAVITASRSSQLLAAAEALQAKALAALDEDRAGLLAQEVTEK